MASLSKQSTVWLTIILATAAAVVCAIVFVIVSSLDSRRFLSLDMVVTGMETPDFRLSELVQHTKDTTATECPRARCEEALEGSGITLFRFAQKDQADSFASGLGNAFASDRIVVRVDDPFIPSSTKDRLRDYLNGTWQSQ